MKTRSTFPASPAEPEASHGSVVETLRDARARLPDGAATPGSGPSILDAIGGMFSPKENEPTKEMDKDEKLELLEAKLEQLQEDLLLAQADAVYAREESDALRVAYEEKQSESTEKADKADKNPENLTSEELKQLSTKMGPGTITSWKEWSADTLLANAPELREILDVPEDEFLKRRDLDKNLQIQDAYFLRMLKATMDKDSVHVMNFRSEVTMHDKLRPGGAKIAKSGYLMWHAMTTFELGGPAMRRANIKTFYAKNHFTDAVDIPTFVLAANNAQHEFDLLPASERAAPNANLRMLLKKMPDRIINTVNKYEEEIDEKEELGEDIRFDYIGLTKILAIAFAKDVDPREATVRAAASRDTNKNGKMCAACGKYGHYASEKDASGDYVCKGKCAVCNHRICPGAHGGECVIFSDEFPDKVTNALKPPNNMMPSGIVEKLKEIRARLNPPKATSRSTATETCGAEQGFWATMRG
jgi:hypothetical protein